MYVERLFSSPLVFVCCSASFKVLIEDSRSAAIFCGFDDDDDDDDDDIGDVS